MEEQKPFSLSTREKILIGLLGLVVLLAGTVVIPQIQVGSEPLKQEEKARIDAETAARLAIIQGIGGLFVFATAAISFLNLKETQKNVLIAEEKQVTERFSKAVEMLGNENISIRLGGIYALERIAKDSDKDYEQVMEVLTAFVREGTKQPAQAHPPTDIQAVLTVIKRRKHSYKDGEEHGLDFRGANLRGANLIQADLQGANLREADLQGANLLEANLRGANLREANLVDALLQRADLEGAFLQRATLLDAHLDQANLKGASLHGANLIQADLQGANLQGANLRGAKLIQADLEGAILTDANLKGAMLTDANLKEVKTPDLKNQLQQCINYKGAQLPDELTENQPSPPEQQNGGS